MIECKELANKTIRLFTIFEDGHYGPDIQIELPMALGFTHASRPPSLLKPPIQGARAENRMYSGITAVLLFLSKPSENLSLL